MFISKMLQNSPTSIFNSKLSGCNTPVPPLKCGKVQKGKGEGGEKERGRADWVAWQPDTCQVGRLVRRPGGPPRQMLK